MDEKKIKHNLCWDEDKDKYIKEYTDKHGAFPPYESCETDLKNFNFYDIETIHDFFISRISTYVGSYEKKDRLYWFSNKI